MASDPWTRSASQRSINRFTATGRETMQMHRLALFCMLSITSHAHAAGYGGASGENALGEIIHITGDMAETLAVQKDTQDTAWVETYDMKQECPTFTDTTLACLPGRASPLSGATYRITTSKRWKPCNLEPYHDKSAGQVYVCIAGCKNARAPKMFHVDPWEC